MIDSNKSQTELIIEKFIENLKTHPEFDDKSLTKIRKLVVTQNLSQYKKIEGAIKSEAEGENEDT